ncbi:MAG TPA: hypothetical protein VMF03_07965 [Steroidobacteraceae bacterium]|nr:hypothetical protein [Steroidobacteraceae bacterium]
MGAEATPSLASGHEGALSAALLVLQAAFVLEIALSLMPAVGALGIISRLIRLARLVRIVSVSGALRNFASGRIRGIAAVISAALLLGLLGYVMALAGFYLFAASGPGHWASLAGALRTVAALLVFREGLAAFTGVASGALWSYLVILYLGELAIVLELLSPVLRRRPDHVSRESSAHIGKRRRSEFDQWPVQLWQALPL